MLHCANNNDNDDTHDSVNTDNRRDINTDNQEERDNCRWSIRHDVINGGLYKKHNVINGDVSKKHDVVNGGANKRHGLVNGDINSCCGRRFSSLAGKTQQLKGSTSSQVSASLSYDQRFDREPIDNDEISAQILRHDDVTDLINETRFPSDDVIIGGRQSFNISMTEGHHQFYSALKLSERVQRTMLYDRYICRPNHWIDGLTDEGKKKVDQLNERKRACQLGVANKRRLPIATGVTASSGY